MTIAGAAQAARTMPAPLARAPVLSAVGAQFVLLALTCAGYGYHRDELYFRMLRPGWGYLDQPPLTPLLARLTKDLIADQVWALRIPAMLASIGSVLLVAAIAREVGGGRVAQGLAAWGYAFAAFPLVAGHVLTTASIDATVWLAVLLLIVRAQLRDDTRCWLWAGVVVGVGLYNKLLIVVLLVALAAGVLISGPRRLLVSRPVLAATAIAIVVGLPNVIYQARNGWPQFEFGRTLAEHNAGDVRVDMWSLLISMFGPPLVAVWGAGLVALWRRPQWRSIRFLVPALPALLVLVFVMGSQPYYEFGLVAALFAIGCVPTADWLARGGPGRLVTVVVLGVVNAVIAALVALPLVPLDDLGATPIAGLNQTVGDTVGWPAYVRQVAAAYRGVPAVQRATTTIVASNYGEAGAIDRYGPALGLPRVYSGQNQLYFQGRPPDSATTAVVVGGQVDDARGLFRSCRPAGKLDNGVDVDNEEQGEPIVVCRGPIGGWAAVWPKFKHED
ncbi:MAG TPA: glycosyltransferase family 39 protein [Jatrophihabitans sp.]|nr:glycosyltransferase family 39 protein [Jatrophihabitans sp.]